MKTGLILLFVYFVTIFLQREGGGTANSALGIYGDTCLTQKKKGLKKDYIAMYFSTVDLKKKILFLKKKKKW